MKLFVVSPTSDTVNIRRGGFGPEHQLPEIARIAPCGTVVLTRDEERARTAAQQWNTGVWEVELDDLAKSLLFPTGCFLAVNSLPNTFENFRCEVPSDVALVASGMPDIGARREYLAKWYARNFERFKARWRRSLDWGEVAHKGPIPARSLHFVPIVQTNTATTTV